MLKVAMASNVIVEIMPLRLLRNFMLESLQTQSQRNVKKLDIN